MKSQIIKAYQKIQKHIYKTPLVKAYALSKELNADIYLKLENIQLTSSFKIRGAFNKLLALSPEKMKNGIVAASSGNHGMAVAFASNQINVQATIFVPQDTEITKIKGIKRFGAKLIYKGRDCLIAEKEAKKYAKENKMEYISPYNDLDVIYGQGTIAHELMLQKKYIDQVYVSVGGGGLISGISAYLKSNRIEIIGCSPQNSPVMAECIKSGKILEIPIKPTLSDGTSGNIEIGSITFDFCRNNIDQFSLVSESEIRGAMRTLIFDEHLLVEGAGAVPLAALKKNKDTIRGKKIVLIICGGNVSQKVLKSVLEY